jgi:chromosome partitioning protein
MRMRGTVKLKLALEFSRFSGAPATFRSLFPQDQSKTDTDYHNLYSAHDIRAARLALMGEPADRERPKTIPPILYTRMAKGGTGKTTVAGNIAATLALMGHRVLMIDGDPQGSLTTLFGIDWAKTELTHIGALIMQYAANPRQSIDFTNVVKPIYPDGMLDLIAADISMSEVDTWLINVPNRETIFQRLLNANASFFSRYDAIVIDASPGSSQLANCFMYAARKILPVVMLDGTSIKAMEVLYSNMTEMAEAFPGIDFSVRIICNGYAHSITACREALETLQAAYPGFVDGNIIPRAAAFQRQISLFDNAASGPVLEREPNSASAKVMIDLTRSLISHYDIQLAGLTPVVQQLGRGKKLIRPKTAATEPAADSPQASEA